MADILWNRSELLNAEADAANFMTVRRGKADRIELERLGRRRFEIEPERCEGVACSVAAGSGAPLNARGNVKST